MGQQPLKSNIRETKQDVSNIATKTTGAMPDPGEGGVPVENTDLQNGSGVINKATQPAAPLAQGVMPIPKQLQTTPIYQPVEPTPQPHLASLTETFRLAHDSIFGLSMRKLAQAVSYMTNKDYTVKVKKDGKSIDNRNLKKGVKSVFKKKEKPPTLLDNVRD